MADTGTYSDDISALWGAPSDSALDPPRPNGSVVANGHSPAPGEQVPTNGRHTVAQVDNPRDDVTRLADALAGHQVDVVRRSELLDARGEMEDAFTHQLAVALYELLSASNDRFAAVEDHLARRLDEVAARLSQSVTAQGDRLAATAEAQQRATTDLARSVRDELVEISDRFSVPVEALVAFEREVRHEVGRLGDVVAAQEAQADRRTEQDREVAAARADELAKEIEESERRAAATAQAMGDIIDRISSVQRDISTLHETITGLREEVTLLRRRTDRARGPWRRSVQRRGIANSRETRTESYDSPSADPEPGGAIQDR